MVPVDPAGDGQIALGFQLFVEPVYDFVGVGFGDAQDLRHLRHGDECLARCVVLLVVWLGWFKGAA